MHGLLRCNINTGVHARVCRADMSLRDITIAWDEKRGYRVRMMSRTRSAQRILGIWRKLVELRLDTERDGWLSLAREALWQVPHEMGGRWKSQNRKIVPLSPYVEKPLNSKVIKSFVPEQRSHKCFSYFKIPMFYVLSLWTFDVHFTHSHVWLWYIFSWMNLILFKNPPSFDYSLPLTPYPWLIDCFYSMSTLIGLFYAKVNLTILVSNYIHAQKCILKIILNR